MLTKSALFLLRSFTISKASPLATSYIKLYLNSLSLGVQIRIIRNLDCILTTIVISPFLLKYQGAYLCHFYLKSLVSVKMNQTNLFGESLQKLKGAYFVLHSKNGIVYNVEGLIGRGQFFT